jgi:hypothetical protein
MHAIYVVEMADVGRPAAARQGRGLVYVENLCQLATSLDANLVALKLV